MFRVIPALLLVGLSAALPAPAEEVRFVHQPEISPDGSAIAFSFAGDIWVVPAEGGDATRITDHVAYEGYPVWSPDGRKIAFASDRKGDFDVYVVPAVGGDPEQITFHSSSDIPCDWTPDGERVLFQTRRSGSEDLWLAHADGRTPVRISGVWLEREAYADLSGDGAHLVYNNNRCTSGWWRRFFRSEDAADIYICAFSLDGIHSRPLVDGPFHDLWPHFSPDGSEVYFVSGREGPLAVYRMPAGGGDATPVARFPGDVHWLSVASEKNILALSAGFDVWTVPLPSGEPVRVAIRCSTEPKENEVEQRTFTGDATEFRVSPDGKKAAFVVRGEIFVAAAEKGGVARRVTRTPWRESDMAWLPDSRRVVYTSDRNGSLDLYIADTKSGEETRLTADAENDSKPLPSPDGEWIAFYRGNHSIQKISPDGGSAREVVRASFLDLRLEPTGEFSWSPDGKWIAYTAYAPDYHTDIHVRNVESGTDGLVSYLATFNHRPVWSPDGKYLYFTSYFQENADTYRVLLKEKKPRFEEDHLDSLYVEDKEEGEDEEKEDKDEAKGKEKEKAEPVVIDFTDIMLRVEAFPDLANNESEPVFVKDGERVVFAADVMGQGKYDLWSYPAKEEEKEKKLEQLTSTEKRKTRLQVVEDAVWYLEGGGIRWIDTAKNDKGSLSFQAEMDVDVEAEREQMFSEAWALLNDQFYDPEYHGASWESVRGEYRQIVPFARTDEDFRTLIRMMIGELSASHLGVYARGGSREVETGYLGIELDHSLIGEGTFRVQSVLPGGPASLEESKIEPGEYILSVDGVELDESTNFFELLGRRVGRRVELEVAESAKGGKKRVVHIKPVGRDALLDLQYEEWVRSRRRLVDELSGGRLAYLHIAGMGQGNLVRFQRELVTLAEQKEGAVIDVRYNGGGSVAVHILGILDRRPFLLRNFRGEPLTQETKMRSYGYNKPTALLINNHSYSNAEIFAEGFRRLGLGPIVGIPTAGSVIGTGAWTLIDGSTFRKPSWGAFTVDGEDLENSGREPDFHVYTSYNDWMDGKDPQIEKAVEEMLKDLDS